MFFKSVTLFFTERFILYINTIMKRLLLLSLLFNVSLGYAQKTIVYDDHAVLRTVPGTFNSIKITDGIDVFLSQGDTNLIAVSASKESIRDKIITEVKDGELLISYGNDHMNVMINSDDKKRKVYISFKNIDKIIASGSSDVYVINKITATNLQIDLSGSSDFRGEVVVTNLTINLSGSSDAAIEGTSSKTSITARGSSDVEGYKLNTDTCDINVSGSSDVSIAVSKVLTAKASGSSDITYKGNPTVSVKSVSGSSSINKKEI